MTLRTKLTIFTFHQGTAYNASNLNGVSYSTESYDGAVIWAVPAGGYDGVLNFEMSPDLGETYFPFEATKTEDSTILSSSYTFSGADPEAFYIFTPEAFDLRVRLSGGTTGTVSVYGRIIDGRF